MKYLCVGDWGTPAVGADCVHETEARALRHARAFAAVVRAAKAERSARLRACRSGAGLVERLERWRKAQDKTRTAVNRLVAVEKEVKRGK